MSRALEPPESAYDEGPYVCPGCYAVGDQPCLPGCIDEEIRRALEERQQDDEAWEDEEDQECHCGFCHWCLQACSGATSGDRSCRWCRELIDPGNDFDHDFCEPDEPTIADLRLGED